MKRVYIRTKDTFNNDKEGRDLFVRCFSIASKYGLVKSSRNDSINQKIILNIEGSRLDTIKYYIETLVRVEKHKMQGLKRIVYLLY